MCGIVGFIRNIGTDDQDRVPSELDPAEVSQSLMAAAQHVSPVLSTDDERFCGKRFLYEGLQRLTYRGYDSCGLAVMVKQAGGGYKIALQKTSGKVDRLHSLLDFLPPQPVAGIAHTRWATHGPPTSINAHPHRQRGLALVHNGIVENSDALRLQLDSSTFLSDTDSEVALWMLHQLLAQHTDMELALLELVKVLEGSFTMVLVDQTAPEKLFVIKQGSPLVIGFGEEGAFCASDVLAMDPMVGQVLFLEDGDVGVLSSDHFKFLAGPGLAQQSKNLADSYQDLVGLMAVSPTIESVNKGDHPHYMYKEIREQPEVVAGILARCVDFETQSICAQELGIAALELDLVNHIHFVGCGSAFYASQLGAMAMEAYGVIPCRVSQASEYRYSSPVINHHTLVIAVSQSGETADTIACVRHALKFGAQVLALCNVDYSSLCRAATSSVLMGAQREVGVASTKAFTAQLLCLLFMAVLMHRRRGFPAMRTLFAELQHLVEAMAQVFAVEEQIKRWAQQISGQTSCLFIGRHVSSAIASEGALKLKEISYIHAEAYPAGELKHGPLALVDSHMLIIAIVPKDRHYVKMFSNIEEVCARGARVMAITTADDPKLRSLCHELLVIPGFDSPYLQSMISAMVLQLAAYHSAVLLGHNVDQPRNLAKSVTVE